MKFEENNKYRFTLEQFLLANKLTIDKIDDTERLWTSYCDGMEVEVMTDEIGIVMLPDGENHITILPEWCERVAPKRLKI